MGFADYLVFCLDTSVTELFTGHYLGPMAFFGPIVALSLIFAIAISGGIAVLYKLNLADKTISKSLPTLLTDGVHHVRAGGFLTAVGFLFSLFVMLFIFFVNAAVQPLPKLAGIIYVIIQLILYMLQLLCELVANTAMFFVPIAAGIITWNIRVNILKDRSVSPWAMPTMFSGIALGSAVAIAIVSMICEALLLSNVVLLIFSITGIVYESVMIAGLLNERTNLTRPMIAHMVANIVAHTAWTLIGVLGALGDVGSLILSVYGSTVHDIPEDTMFKALEAKLAGFNYEHVPQGIFVFMFVTHSIRWVPHILAWATAAARSIFTFLPGCDPTPTGHSILEDQYM